MESLLPSILEVDVLVLAGDICNTKCAKEVLTWFSDHYKNVVYINGNHECFGTSLDDYYELMQEITSELPNLHYLHPTTGSVEIDGQRFIGGCLWYPKNPSTEAVGYSWIDFSTIYGGRKTIYKENMDTVQFLLDEMQEGDIVVTHMLPSYKSVSPEWEGAETNCFFANELDAIIRVRKPKLWAHGHTHCPADYYIAQTRIICNPKGYPQLGEGNNFNPQLIIEV